MDIVLYGESKNNFIMDNRITFFCERYIYWEENIIVARSNIALLTDERGMDCRTGHRSPLISAMIVPPSSVRSSKADKGKTFPLCRR